MEIEAIIKLLLKGFQKNPQTDYIKNIINISDVINKNSELKILKDEVTQLLEKRNNELKETEENAVKQIIYKCLKIIFCRTTQKERFLYLEKLLDTTYTYLLQKLIELKQFSSIISKDDYNVIVKSYIPFVKLDMVVENDKNIEELIEYLRDPTILREDTYKIIKNKLNKQNFTYLGFKILPVTEKNGFLAEYAKLEVFGKCDEVLETHKFFVKFVPTVGFEFVLTTARLCFSNEYNFYSKFVKTLEQIGLKDLDFLPKCYFASNNYLVMEDMSSENYLHLKPLTNFDYEYCLITLKQLAKMHACSFIFEEKCSEIFGNEVRIDEYFPEMITEIQIQDNESSHCNIETAVRFLKKFQYLAKDITMEEFQIRTRNLLETVFKKNKKSNKYRNVIAHGDIWWNNIFYKQDENKKPTRCLLVDFQLIRYIPPAYDLIMVFYICTNMKTRKELMFSLIKQYYNEMTSILQKYNIKIESVLPYNDLWESFEDLKIFGLYLPIMYHWIHSIPRDILEKKLSIDDNATKFWHNVDFRYEFFDSVWEVLEKDPRFEENAKEMYEYCLKNI